MLVQYLEGENRVLKCLSDTRWSARAEATKALSEGYDDIRAAFHILCKILNSEQIPNKKLTAFVFRYLTRTLHIFMHMAVF